MNDGSSSTKHLTADPHDRDRFARLKDAGEFVFAGVLTLYGVFGYYLVRDQLSVMRQQTAVMQQQTKLLQEQLADSRKAAAEGDKVTERQLKIAESQADSLAKLAHASKVSADNSDRIARGSEAAVNAAQESVRLDQRAWIGVTNITGKPVVGEPLKIRVMYQNTGRTPATAAKKLCFVAVADRGKQPVFPPFDKTMPAADQVLSRSVIPPNGSNNVTGSLYLKATLAPYPFTQANVESVTNGTVVLYVRALITYDDIFGRHHWVTACYSYDPNLISGPDQYTACDWGNLVDRDGEPPPP
jgi:hypothetical protein